MAPALDYSQVADLYDAYVRFDEDIPFFLEECRHVRGPVLELMSGTGRVSLALLDDGANLTCVDASTEMLEVLKRKLEQRGLHARVIQQDIQHLRLDRRFPLVLLPFHSFEEFTSQEGRCAALRAIFAHTQPSGRFICTLHNPVVHLRSVGPSSSPSLSFRVPGSAGETVLRSETEYDERTHLVRGVQIFEQLDEAGDKTRERRLPIRFALLEPGEFRSLAEQAGFEVEQVYGDYQRSRFEVESSRYMVWCLRRPVG
jgi:ubiquinone/menaquinone biosynthesis C-methylase UbiE